MWQSESKWRNETMFLGPHPLLATLQQEMNLLGRQDRPWSINGWKLETLGWVGCMVRSVEIKTDEEG